MKKLYLVLILTLLAVNEGDSQDFFWKTSLFSFFDNIESGGSSVKVPQTMAGIMIFPEAGFILDSVHKVGAGINLMHEFGSSGVIDRIYPTAWYEYDSRPFRFVIGAFPRAVALEKYPRLFFQDSLSYYRPNVNGMLLEYSGGWGFASVWLDWTGRQSETVREAFFVGLSGRYNIGIFSIRNFSYMFHFADRMNPLFSEALHDYLLFQTSAGVDLGGKTFFDRLEGSAGWVIGLERARADNTGWIDLHGLHFDMCAEYRFAGIFNTLYIGQEQMYFYGTHQNDLYWGDPVYRTGIYDRTDLYIRFLRREDITIELTWSLHFLERRVYHEQMLKVRVNVGGRRALR